MKPAWHWVLCLFCLLSVKSQGQECLQIGESFKSSFLTGCLTVFTDSTGTIPPEKLTINNFHKPLTETPNFGTDGLTHWLSFSCKNESHLSKQLIVEVDIVYADAMSFYVFDRQTLIQKIERDSWHTYIWDRKVPSRYFAFPLSLEPSQSVRVFISAQERGGTLVLPVSVWDNEEFTRRAARETLAFLAPATLLFFLAVISLILYFLYPNPLWVFYALHAIGTSIYILNIEGFLAHYTPPPFNSIKGYAIGTSLSWLANLFFAYYFVYKPFLKTPRWVVYANYVVSSLHAVWLLTVFATPFQEDAANISLIMNGFSVVFMFSCLLFCAIRGSQDALLYTIGIGPLLLSIFIRILNSADLFPVQTWHYYFRYYAPLFEIIVLGIGTLQQLIRDREATLKRLDAAQKEVIFAQDSERERIAADLHDDLGGVIATLSHQLDQSLQINSIDTLKKEILSIKETTSQAGDKVRSIAHNLMPPDFERLGLIGSTQQLVQSLNDHRFSVEVFGLIRRLAPPVELNAYRIISELIHNVQKHAQAQRVAIQLLYHTDSLCIVIDDDGLGIRLTKKANKQVGIGLKNISSRVNYLHAHWHIDSSEQGTTTIVDIPYDYVPGQHSDR